LDHGALPFRVLLLRRARAARRIGGSAADAVAEASEARVSSHRTTSRQVEDPAFAPLRNRLTTGTPAATRLSIVDRSRDRSFESVRRET